MSHSFTFTNHFHFQQSLFQTTTNNNNNKHQHNSNSNVHNTLATQRRCIRFARRFLIGALAFLRFKSRHLQFRQFLLRLFVFAGYCSLCFYIHIYVWAFIFNNIFNTNQFFFNLSPLLLCFKLSNIISFKQTMFLSTTDLNNFLSLLHFFVAFTLLQTFIDSHFLCFRVHHFVDGIRSQFTFFNKLIFF